MAKITTDDQHYKNIANMIRNKAGIETTFKPSEMPQGIEAVYEQGYIDGGAGQGEGGSSLAPVIKKTVSGNPIHLNDASENEYNFQLQLSSDTISDFSEVKVRVSGKNLVNLNNARIGYTLSGAGFGNVIYLSKNEACVVIPGIRVAPDAIYSFSLDNTDYWLNRICQMDKNNKCTENHSFYTNTAYDYSQRLIKTQSDTTWVALSLRKKTGDQIANLADLKTINLQFEKKGHASDFEFYWEEEYSIDEFGRNIEIKNRLGELNFSIVESIDIPSSNRIDLIQPNILMTIQYEQSYSILTERRSFWRDFQQNGKRKNYSYAFYGYTEDMFYPCCDIVPDTITYGLAETKIGNLKQRLEENNVILDLSNLTNASFVFRGGTYTHLPSIDFTKATTVSYCFYLNDYLQTIDEIKISDKITNFDNMLTQCKKLVNLKISGIIAGKNFSTAQSVALSRESIISIVNALSADTTGLTVTFSKKAVDNAFADGEVIGSESEEWGQLINEEKSNWTFSLV